MAGLDELTKVLTMQLHNEEIYGQELAGKITSQGRYTMAVANRWMLGWPTRVRAMLDGKVFFDWLMGQVNTEKDILADEPNAQHLSEREILEMHEVRLAPPAMCDDPDFVGFALGQVVVEDLGGLQMLKDRQRKDSEEVAAGLRDPRSLLAVGKSDLDGATFKGGPDSEFSKVGLGW